MKDGPDALQRLVQAAEPMPIRGLFRFSDFEKEIDSYYGMAPDAARAAPLGGASKREGGVGKE